MAEREVSLEEVKAGIKEITDADPGFTYPQQGEDPRCGCTANYVDEDEVEYDAYGCEWHVGDDNTCRYVHEDGSPSCVVGHYYSKSLGIPTEFIAGFETKAPRKILEEYGLTVSAEANKFLNTIQAQQDQGYEWSKAYERAEKAMKWDPHPNGGGAGSLDVNGNYIEPAYFSEDFTGEDDESYVSEDGIIEYDSASESK